MPRAALCWGSSWRSSLRQGHGLELTLGAAGSRANGQLAKLAYAGSAHPFVSDRPNGSRHMGAHLGERPGMRSDSGIFKAGAFLALDPTTSQERHVAF